MRGQGYYEFSSHIETDYIPIPSHLNIDFHQVKVILLNDDMPIDSIGKVNHTHKHFDAMRIHTKGFKFDREEANER